jgi:glycosyltransferase involved in cell wall biosynthesis
MKISAHCNITNPEAMGYPYLESIKSYVNVCDEVIVVDGGSTDGSLEKIAQIPKVKIIQGHKWERDFDWTILVKNIQIGYEACTGDWAFKFDTDYVFHERYEKELRRVTQSTNHLPAIEMMKRNFVTVNMCYDKNNYPFLLNKKFPNIVYGIGHDYNNKTDGATFLYPIIKSGERDGIATGEYLKVQSVRMERSPIRIYCYDFTFMTVEQIKEQRERFNNSLERFIGKNLGSNSFDVFKNMMIGRFKMCKKINVEEQPEIIREKVRNIRPEQFGYDMFNHFKNV